MGIPLAKSIVNRVLILSSFDLPEASLLKTGTHESSAQGRLDLLLQNSHLAQLNLNELEAYSDDIRELETALDQLARGETSFRFHDGGTSFRFFLARLSRRPGKFKIELGDRLKDRPHDELFSAIRKLSISCDFNQETGVVSLESDSGWQGSEVTVDCTRSSQFATALCLASANTEEIFKINVQNLNASHNFLDLSLRVCHTCGFEVSYANSQIEIKPNHLKSESSESRIKKFASVLELDSGAVAALIACLAQKRGGQIQHYLKDSFQPDHSFVKIFEKLGFSLQWKDGQNLNFSLDSAIQSGEFDFSQAPDLVPVVAALCAMGNGRSRLSGLELLRYKESDRISKTIELISGLGGLIHLEHGDLIIEGRNILIPKPGFRFDCEKDHRMAMACGVFLSAGLEFEVENTQVVSKSFPDFWNLIGLDKFCS